ncbi:MAG TPA: hypothetical protein VK891_14235 [Euzebyales bacterium]|nr:hypothetical protein [Euzebyales bacterium]
MRTTSFIHARARRLRVLLAVLVAALFLQACAQPAATDSTEGSSAAADQESAAPAAGDSEAASADEAAEDDDQAAAGGEVAGINLDGDFCAISNQLDDSDMFDKQPENAEEFAETADQIKQIYVALDDKAPAEIADDVKLLTETGTQQIDLATRLTAEADEDPTEVLADPEVAEQMAQFDEDGKFTRASKRLDRWTKRNC